MDFERYLQPSQRCSLSPRETVAMETLSPMAVDIEMESPRGQSEDLLTQQEAGMIDAHRYCACIHTVCTPGFSRMMDNKAAVSRISILKFV